MSVLPVFMKWRVGQGKSQFGRVFVEGGCRQSEGREGSPPVEATRGPLAVDRTCTEIVVSVLGDERFAPPLAPLSGDPHLDAAELLGCRDLETPLDNLSSKPDAKVERTLNTFSTTSPCNVSADCSLPLPRPIPHHELARDRLNPPHDRGSGCPESEFSRGCTSGRPLETLPGVASKGVAFPSPSRLPTTINRPDASLFLVGVQDDPQASCQRIFERLPTRKHV